MPERLTSQFAKPPKKSKRPLHIFLLVMVLVATYIFWALLKPLPLLKPTRIVIKPPTVPTVSLAWPAYGEAAAGAEGYGLLASHGRQLAIPSASVVKVITALTILQKKPLETDENGPTLVMTEQDVAAYDTYVAAGGSVVPVQIGEKLTERQMLEALLLPSANNIAESLAVWAFGSEAEFTRYANTYMKQLGLADTHLADASGFAPATVTTAADLVRVGLVAMQNPVIAGIVAKPTAIIPGAGTVRNVNFLLGTNGIIGIKTGNTDQAGGVFLLASKVNVGQTPVTIVTAIMGAGTLYQSMRDSLTLLNSVKAKFTEHTLIKAGDGVGYYLLPWGDTVDAIAQKDVKAVSWQNEVKGVDTKLDKLPAAAKAGQAVGTITIRHSATSQTKVPVILKETPSLPSWQWRLMHP